MRFLKTKIAKAQEFLQNQQAKVEELALEEPVLTKSTSTSSSSASASPKKRRRLSGSTFTPQSTLKTKNIVKNFGRAISTFAVSHLAMPYLIPLVDADGVTLEGFISYVKNRKNDIDGLNSFRSMLMPSKEDTKETIAYRKIFTALSEVFINYFSVNWIFHGKVQHKEAHLKFRYKMLRRIKAPELFTYLKKGTTRKDKN